MRQHGCSGCTNPQIFGNHLLHPLILRLSVLCAPADFEAQSSLLQNRLFPQIQIHNAYPVTLKLKIKSTELLDIHVSQMNSVELKSNIMQSKCSLMHPIDFQRSCDDKSFVIRLNFLSCESFEYPILYSQAYFTFVGIYCS